ILRRAQLNAVRRTRPELVGDHADLDGRRPAFGSPGVVGPEQRHTDRELSAPLDRAVASLGAHYRTVLLLVDVDQLSYAEAAEVLGVPVGTVMSRLSRARDKVRRQLRPTEGSTR
ncbi:MAG: RNA polymerase sigma factor, partial [Jatrophihabitans sp.]